MSDEFDAFTRAAETLHRSDNPEAAVTAVRRSVGGLLARVAELQAGEFVGEDSSGLIGARVDGTGRVVAVNITPYALRDLPVDEIGPRCMEAITTARGQIADSLRTGLQELTGADIDFDAEPVNLAEKLRALSRTPS